VEKTEDKVSQEDRENSRDEILAIYRNLPSLSKISLSALKAQPELTSAIESINAAISEKKQKIERTLTDMESNPDIKAAQNIMPELLGLSSSIEQYTAYRSFLLRMYPQLIPLFPNPAINLCRALQTRNVSVMSVDIRRSTDLMLKAVNSYRYVCFIRGLTEQLESIILNHYGVFDKFTRDGILAYFPDGDCPGSGIQNSCLAAQACHDFFRRYYPENYTTFQAVPVTGLGIGIDYGEVIVELINHTYTIVGHPVVYAYRLSGAPANHTYLNQRAVNAIVQARLLIPYVETTFDIKHDGPHIFYDLQSVSALQIISPC